MIDVTGIALRILAEGESYVIAANSRALLDITAAKALQHFSSDAAAERLRINGGRKQIFPVGTETWTGTRVECTSLSSG